MIATVKATAQSAMLAVISMNAVNLEWIVMTGSCAGRLTPAMSSGVRVVHSRTAGSGSFDAQWRVQQKNEHEV
jgi:hypothetical protein